MHFIGRGMLAISADSLEETCESIEATCQLMSIPFVKLVFQKIIPGKGFITIQCVPSGNTDIFVAWILSQFNGDVIEIFFRALTLYE